MPSQEKNLVCFSPIDWDEVWEGPQEIMSRFAGDGWKVLFVENVAGRTPRFTRHDAARAVTRVKKVFLRKAPRVAAPEHVTVHTPGNLPPYPWLRAVNRGLLLRGLRARLRDLGWECPVVWSYIPSALVRETALALSPRLLVYCCIHDYASISKQHAYLAEEEKSMLRAADLVFVLSRQLLEERKKINPAAQLLPQGANLGDYLSPSAPEAATDLQKLPRPIIGYIGTIHEWVDQELLQYAARQRPAWSFVLVGPEKVNTQLLRDLPNVALLGSRPHGELPGLVRQFDAGIIPYLTQGFARTIRPNKVLEYLVMGKPVITSDLPELAEYRGHIALARSRVDFVREIELALQTDSPEKQVARRKLAEANSIENKFRELSAELEKKLQGREARVIAPARETSAACVIAAP